MKQKRYTLYFVIGIAWCWLGQTYIDPNEKGEQTVADQVQQLSAAGQEAFRQRVAELIEEKLGVCRQNAILNATLYVDSLIIQEAIENKRLQSRIPYKPQRPEAPAQDINLDSIPLRPILDSTIR
jgi:hypothetical protein